MTADHLADASPNVRAALDDAGIPWRPETLRPLGGGENSLVVEVRTDGSAPVVLKLYPEELAWKRDKEVYVYGLLASTPGVRVPSVVASGDVAAAGATTYVVLSKIEGVMAGDVIPSLPPSGVAGIYEGIGAVLRRIHSVTFDTFGYLTTEVIDPHPTNGAYMRFQFEKKLREFEELGGPAPIRERVERFLDGAGPVFEACGQAVLCHDDIHEWNVLLEQADDVWQVSGIVDVENAVAADPLLDLAKVDLYAIRDDQDKRRGLFDGYGPMPPGGEEALAVYVVYHALELWDWFALIGDIERAASALQDLDRLTTERGVHAR